METDCGGQGSDELTFDVMLSRLIQSVGRPMAALSNADSSTAGIFVKVLICEKMPLTCSLVVRLRHYV